MLFIFLRHATRCILLNDKTIKHNCLTLKRGWLTSTLRSLIYL